MLVACTKEMSRETRAKSRWKIKEELMMKGAYPILISKGDEWYYVRIPDFDIETQGENIPDAMDMARDAIGIMGIDYEDDGKKLPEADSIPYVKAENEILTLVDVDFTEYRKKVDNRAVKKNCTIPYWMNEAAEKAGINFSKLLQDAIVSVLGLEKQRY